MGPACRQSDRHLQRDTFDYLLISAMNSLTASRISAELASGGLVVAETELGLEVCCQGLDWRALLESIALTLSPLERRDTRIATFAVGCDRAALHRSIFRAKSLERLLDDIRESWLDDMLQRNRITIHLQPLMQYPPGRLHGYECLMRGVDADGRSIPPTRVLETARRLDKISILDEQCRLAALRRAAQLAQTGLTFFVNFLPSSIANPQRWLESTLAEISSSGLRPEQVAFEVVETDRVVDRRHLVDILRRFRKAGFKIALDDVGAGYSSLLSLSYMRPDYIKLDGELVRRAATSALEAKMVADLAETARQNGIITVAEGIETAQELRAAMNCGIRITQGYFHARPQLTQLSADQLNAAVNRMAHVSSERVGQPAV